MSTPRHGLRVAEFAARREEVHPIYLYSLSVIWGRPDAERDGPERDADDDDPFLCRDNRLMAALGHEE